MSETAKKIDKVMPQNSWVFSEEVASCFDNMLERSIPDYRTMRKLVQSIAFRYVRHKEDIVDLGCSNGIAIKPFVDRFGATNRYTLMDVSEPMLDKCREKYRGWIDTGVMQVSNIDITKDFPRVNACVIMSVLTLQFTPIEYRPKIVKRIYDALLPGGAFLFVEKVLGESADMDDLLVDEYYAIKRENGYTTDQIEAKRKSLEGVLVPITAKWNEELLRNAGFSKVECFWRCLNFCGWVAIK